MYSMINSNTNVACLIGSPVSHSLSPIIHNSIYQFTSRNMVYLSFDIKPTNAKEFTDAVKTLDIKAFNITMPNKEVMLEHVDEVVGDHKSINTVRNDNGRLVATSTDSQGFIHLLKKNMVDIADKTIVIIGSGATSAIIIESIRKLSHENNTSSKIIITARTERKLKQLAEKEKCDYVLLDEVNTIPNIDILINTTPLGMHSYKDNFENFHFLQNVAKGGFVIDCIYNPWNTKLLEKAKSKELNAINGIDMLLGQAFASHTFWFGEELDYQIIEKVSRKVIASILHKHVYYKFL